MIRVNAVGFGQFYAAHAILRAAGVEVTASGGNEMRVPDDTRLDVLRAVAGTGTTVYADLADADGEASPAPERQPGGEPEAPEATSTDTPARKPRKTTTRRTSTKE